MTPDDVFVGSPPLAFTFGLGGLAIFPLRFGATATLLENASPANMIGIIETYKATICFTAPTAYRAMMAAMDAGADLSSLRLAVSAGETLPAPVFRDWVAKTGTPILDGIGTTELLHIFISNRVGDAHPGCTGRTVTGYEARIVDEHMREVPRGVVGPARRARADRLPLSRRRPADQLRARRLEPDRRRVRAGRGWPVPFRRAHRRHDPVGGLQHRRPGSGGRAACAPGRGRMRRGRPAGRGARPDRRRVRGAAPRRRARRGHGEAPAGSREGVDRSLQVPARRHRSWTSCRRRRPARFSAFACADRRDPPPSRTAIPETP